MQIASLSLYFGTCCKLTANISSRPFYDGYMLLYFAGLAGALGGAVQRPAPRTPGQIQRPAPRAPERPRSRLGVTIPG